MVEETREEGGLKKVVIVGAGMAGSTAGLKLLEKKRPFTILNPTDYFHLNFASVRALCVPGWAEKSLIPLSPVFGSSFKEGKAVGIETHGENGGTITLESGEKVPYDHLVIATGTTNKWPCKLVGVPAKEALDGYKQLVDRVKAAEQVVIIGGGATGVETVAEIKHVYPDKNVTLIQSQNGLIPESNMTETSQKALQDQLTNDFKAKLVLGEKVTNLNQLPITGPGVVQTDKGSSIKADVVFKFIGLNISQDCYKHTLGPAMTQRGALKVDSTFKVEGFKNIYAIGDCTGIEEPKVGMLAKKHGEIMAQNILNMDQGKPLTSYKPNQMPFSVGISLGPESGFGRTKGDWKMPVFMLKKIKAQNLFTNEWWPKFKQECPS